MTSLKLPPVMRYRWLLCQWGRERLRCDRETVRISDPRRTRPDGPL